MGGTIVSIYVKEQIAGLLEDFHYDFKLRDDPGYDEEYAETGLRDWLNAKYGKDAAALEMAEIILGTALSSLPAEEYSRKYIQTVVKIIGRVRWRLERGARKWPECYDKEDGDGWGGDKDE